MLSLPVTRFVAKRAWMGVPLLVAAVCFGWGAYAAYRSLSADPDVFVRLAAGSAITRRYHIMESFDREARSRDLYVEVVPTQGFEDSIEHVAEGKTDLAVVSSGLRTNAAKDVQLLAGFEVDALHILVRRSIAEKHASLFEMLRGRRINLGHAGTNDYMLASDVLHFLRLHAKDASGKGDFVEMNLTKDELAALARDVQAESGLQRARRLQTMPDVILTVVSQPSVLAQSLLDTGEYELVPFPYVEPYLMSNLPEGAEAGDGVDRLLVERATIGGGMYLGESPMPAWDCPTIGLRTLLIARKDIPAASIARVMETIFETDFARRVNPKSPRDVAAPYKIHPEAEAYLDRDEPLITSSVCDAASELFSIVGAFGAGALSIYGYLRRRNIRRPGEYLDEIREIDALVSGQRPDAGQTLSAGELDLRLTQLKERIIHDYCCNRVQGEMVLLSVLSILADSRSQLRAAPTRTSSENGPSVERKPGLAA
jgi:TRAP-type uncharacterized transport system substrate-binding protein